MPLLDLIKFSRELATRRNKAALLLTPDIREQHACAVGIAAAIGAPHFDVLDRFHADTTLADRLGGFSADDLFKLIAAQKSKLLVVSGIEFLLAAWLAQGDAKQVKRSLCQQIELWERAPAFLLVTQHDPVFAAYQPARHTGSQVIIELSQTLSLT
jgi:hypothetical protein